MFTKQRFIELRFPLRVKEIQSVVCLVVASSNVLLMELIHERLLVGDGYPWEYVADALL